MFIGMGLEFALRFSHQINDLLVGPFQLIYFPLGLAAVYIAWMLWAEKRFASGLMEFMLMAVALTIGLTLAPEGPFRWFISLIASGSTVIMLAASGKDPSHLLGPSTAPIHTDQVMAAFAAFRGNLESLMIGKVGEQIEFGGQLPKACADAWHQTQLQHLSSTDPKWFDAIGKLPQCKDYVDIATQPDSGRAMAACLLAVIGLAFFGVILYMIFPTIKGQIRAIAALATAKLLILGLALPGPLRGPSLKFVLFAFIGLLTTLYLAVIFSIILLFMVAIWAATPMLPMGWRIVLMIGVPFAFTTTMANFDRKARKKAKSLSENAHKRKGISQSLQQPLKAKGGSTVLRGSRLMSRKQALVMGAAGGVAGGVADAAMTTHRGAKSAVCRKQPASRAGARCPYPARS
jgi:hypothetical protein